MRELLNKIIFSLGCEVAIVSWSKFAERVCKVCRKPWHIHWINGEFRCEVAEEAVANMDLTRA